MSVPEVYSSEGGKSSKKVIIYYVEYNYSITNVLIEIF